MIKTDVCILGGGAGGIGCAYRLIKNGLKTVVVDKNSDFGGSMVFSGVDGWEPGVSLDGLHKILYKKLSGMEKGCHVVAQSPEQSIFNRIGRDGWDYAYAFDKWPWALSQKSDFCYEDTYKRVPYRYSKRLQFDPKAFVLAVNEIFAEHKENLATLFGYGYKSCKTDGDKIVSITVSDGQNTEEIFADVFVDSSGDIVLARDAGCKYSYGTEGYEDYNEPSATIRSDRINAVSFVFRIAKAETNEHIDQIPKEFAAVDIADFKNGQMKHTVSCIVEYPNGDYNINMLPTMEGNEYFSLGADAEKICKARVWAYWNYLQTEKNMKGFTLTHIYDAGVRESYRLKGNYILREQDLRAGEPLDIKSEKIVAIADHATDIHGQNGMCKELEKPYGIPIECAMTKEFGNLFVACRGASFTHIAASSARLNRTMISMGEGVGEYIAEKFFNK
ncbi:MAG: FAD-dependent oxidoreductase [Clostridia bacterium]|nr:FAD-dependent oxidoreductase [Clostridia bacterium]